MHSKNNANSSASEARFSEEMMRSEGAVAACIQERVVECV